MLDAFKTSFETYRQENQQTACHYDSMFLALDIYWSRRTIG